MFISYWFIIFISIFFPVFWFCTAPSFRKIWILAGSLLFHYKFAGPAGVLPIAILGIITYIAGIVNFKPLRIFAIALCVLALIFYKYTTFLLGQIIGTFDATFAKAVIDSAKHGILPDAPPLAISFFVFEFVHYLVDIQRGKQPIKSVVDFTLFSVFWPSVVAGPVKRFQQFLPAVVAGCRKVSLIDIQVGTMRIAMGLIKKLVIADNLTAYIDFWQPQFAALPMGQRWLLVFAISLRILFDFSGYSDIAIGFARLMGIKLPENFRWPYLATSLQEFWHRWHISLSTWIRDYIYIPLGGNQHGILRKISNGIIAFAICGLWHGAAWNFIFWGLYHGIGLVISTHFKSILSNIPALAKARIIAKPIAWFSTFTYVSIGWLYFFYPVKEATNMLLLLLRRTA